MIMSHKILGNSREEDVGIVKHWPTPCTSPPPYSSTTTNLASSSQDYKRWLEELAPHEQVPQYPFGDDTGENNANAHIVPQVLVLGRAPGSSAGACPRFSCWGKRQVMGREVVVAITGGFPDF